MLKITNTIIIEDEELDEKFIRSPGAGGQHVNKTSNSVQLRFNAKACPTISATVYARLKTIASHLITEAGEIIVTVHSHRSLQRNREEARERLSDLIRKATIQPKKRRPPSLANLRKQSARIKRNNVARSRKTGEKSPGQITEEFKLA